MIQQAVKPLPELYEADETAWLDPMAELVRQRRYDELDYAHLGEYLSEMAGRDRREGESRLTTLLAHRLKWNRQSDHRTPGWRGTIIEQQQELETLAASGVLRNHAEAVLPRAHARAVKRAASETSLPAEAFPAECPYTLEQLLTAELPGDGSRCMDRSHNTNT